MSPRALLLAFPLLLALALGAWDDVAGMPAARVANPAPPGTAHADRIPVEADLHVHAFPGDGALAPWNLIRLARRRGLDVIAITNHNQRFTGRAGAWLGQRLGGVVVVAGAEITHPGHHIIALGTDHAVPWRQPAAGVIADIHAAGGVAIAAHPNRPFWVSLDQAALATFDGTEVLHPQGDRYPTVADEFRELNARARGARAPGTPGPAAIGSSDFHTVAELGRYRTRLWVKTRDQAGVLEAIRSGHAEPLDAHAPAVAAPPPERARKGGWIALAGAVLLLVIAPRHSRSAREREFFSVHGPG